ncbi:MAG: TIGR02281 family clan AA aspartic protease [Candidatus Thiodiazotropha lotti]|uniref:Aspartyl protease n=1 Tax=Candidatus Thiodiazotropha endoloripes TaxID=1818881 RepID=A0A1E2URB7_9GAMM|nr:TIGR02281 family clan AA aspartic protease [Candidatus Thiodiazotropha endoloripes]MCG7897725.1 TIGR02281 family clan AA aspartic protease [Candidatus Thiodiazotropha weberae]MCG7990167.1 TIGR02281 family clan AA aspartic protease [Candidatus Thiodiazotropha lotti]MCG7902163.1 TIGR02281 family clan AA aspartic protease [Candidatus Thiodiazotropha weberae]MCG7913966.1 TIGR02281 family clan AA aspartic protease [Candidatus Thiodiazotropha weberae]MCG7999197.1 TIGR02281 family clan AA aspartic
MTNRCLLICLLWLSLTASPAIGVERIVVEALFADKAMVSIDGVRRLLKLNKPSPEGVLLISASSKQAVIEVDGKRDTYQLGGHISSQFSKPEQVTAKVWRDLAGAYSTVGTINGLTVNFLVDTGATAVAMNTSQAKRLGVQYRYKGKPIMVNTANGVTKGYEVTLDRVQVGDITLRRVKGFVIEGSGPGRVLLGMSFLNRVKMDDQGDVLVLEKRF